ncbi:unnamed protein product [Heligmosomoides polygyrus]|uniref:Uncharacterized protein n=1 Tax=Heligmosomoides polygyrus TaxID=6339 RepID=A0A183FLS5_HELPZ|nr:unnamed protein product [Heligmosomoides polygyrus]
MDLEVQANSRDGVVISAKKVVVPSQTGFSQLVGFLVTPNLHRMVSLRKRSNRVTPTAYLSIFVCITLKRLSISFVTGQHSAPYVANGRTTVL